MKKIKRSFIKHKVFFALVLMGFIFTSCSKDEEIIPKIAEFPLDIISTPISTSNFSMAIAESQTPINIVSSNSIAFYSIDPIIHYGKMKLNSLVNNKGINLEVNVTGLDSINNYITIRGKKYYLVNFHFHYSSEHTIDGKYSAMEVHLVNVAADNSYVVLGILIDLGTENSALQNLFAQSPIFNNTTSSPNSTFNIPDLFPNNTYEYYTYSGSLTTPNYGINSALVNAGPVTWFVYKNKIHLSDIQLSSYKSIYTESNFRTIQPLNGRKTYVRQGY